MSPQLYELTRLTTRGVPLWAHRDLDYRDAVAWSGALTFERYRHQRRRPAPEPSSYQYQGPAYARYHEYGAGRWPPEQPSCRSYWEPVTATGEDLAAWAAKLGAANDPNRPAGVPPKEWAAHVQRHGVPVRGEELQQLLQETMMKRLLATDPVKPS